MRMLARHQIGQGADAVFPVPFAHIVQILFYRIIGRYIFGIQMSVDVPVPSMDAFLQSLDGNAVAHTLVHRAELKMDSVSFAILQIISHGVVSEFVTTFQKFLQTNGSVLIFAHRLALTKPFRFGIHIMESGADAHFVLVLVVMTEGTDNRLFFGNARLETFHGQPGEQWFDAIASLPVLHLLECPMQGSLKQCLQSMIRVIARFHTAQWILLS